ncbi:MAG: CHC2 zinc finger domain-containing protein, partial [Thiohalorhabdaceae bacterium]
MGRIPQSFIDDLLGRADIVEVIDEYVPLKKQGSNFKARCPFHEERTASFNVNPERQIFHCFGCGAGGNAIGFLMEFEHLRFPEAVRELAGRYGLEVPE